MLFKNTNKDRTKCIVVIGFSIVLSLMAIIVVLGLLHIAKLNQAMNTIVSTNNTKTELAYTMRDAIRYRAISLRNMFTTQDIFKRDEEYMRFKSTANRYAYAREQMQNMELDNLEQEILQKLNKTVRNAQPINEKAANALLGFIALSHDEINQVLQSAFDEQDKVLVLLDSLVELQKNYTKASVARAQEEFNKTLIITLLVCGIILIVSILIARYVARYVVRKKNEMLHATRSKSIFLANMSHEIRTPLTAIIGFAEELLDNRQTLKERDQAIKTIIRNGDHLLQIINDILDLSKVEADKIELDKQSFLLFTLLNDLHLILNSLASDNELKFKINYEFPLPERINNDSLRLKQVIINLCNNAIKFTKEGHVNLNVSFDEECDKLKFEVIDTGVGLTQTQIDKIFLPFKQADTSTTRKFGGTGLGLTLSKRLIELMGGSINVESLIGVGSRFTFTIDTGPVDKANLLSEITEINQPTREPQTTSTEVNLSGSILVADDNPDNQRLIKIFTDRTGADITIVNNGKEAVETALTKVFDIIFMDMQMPVMDGITATETLRNKGYKNPIIALTANAFKSDREKCFKAGCDDFISKPINRDRFFEILSSHLEVVEAQKQEVTPIMSEYIVDNKPNIEHKYIIDALPAYIQTLTNHVENACLSFDSGDWQELANVVHNIKGTGSSYGYPIVTELGDQLQFQVSNQNTDNTRLLLDELKRVSEYISIGFEQYQKYQQESPKFA